MDFIDDQGTRLARFFRLSGGELPDFVKNGSLCLDRDEMSGLNKTAFADPVKRRYPIHNKVTTWVSNLYARMNGESNEAIKTALSRASSFFRIDNEVYRIEEVLARKMAAAPEEEPEAVVVDLGDTGTYVCPSDEGSIKTAMDRLCDPRERKEFSADGLRRTARALSDAASNLGVVPPETVQKIAGYGVPEPDRVYGNLMARVIGMDFESREEFAKIASEIKNASDITPDEADKLVDIIDRLDQKHGLRKFYGSKFPPPHESVFTGSIEKYACFVDKIAIDGQEFLRQDLESKEAIAVIRAVIPSFEGSADELRDLDEKKAEAVRVLINATL